MLTPATSSGTFAGTTSIAGRADSATRTPRSNDNAPAYMCSPAPTAATGALTKAANVQKSSNRVGPPRTTGSVATLTGSPRLPPDSAYIATFLQPVVVGQ